MVNWSKLVTGQTINKVNGKKCTLKFDLMKMLKAISLHLPKSHSWKDPIPTKKNALFCHFWPILHPRIGMLRHVVSRGSADWEGTHFTMPWGSDPGGGGGMPNLQCYLHYFGCRSLLALLLVEIHVLVWGMKKRRKMARQYPMREMKHIQMLNHSIIKCFCNLLQSLTPHFIQ